MKIFSFIVFFVVFVSVLGDCGCLNCGKNLRVVSKPNSPITVVYRGEVCYPPRAIPYRIEVPKKSESSYGALYPLKAYSYRIQEVKAPEQIKAQQVLYKHGYKVEVPQNNCGDKPCRYFLNLHAKTDRVVMQEPEGYSGYTGGYIMPKPCSSGPIIQYLKASDCEDLPHRYTRVKRQILRRPFFRFFRFFEKPKAKIKKISGSDQSRIKVDFKGVKKIPRDFFQRKKCFSRRKKSISSQDRSIPIFEIFEKRKCGGKKMSKDVSGDFLKKKDEETKEIPLQIIKDKIKETLGFIQILIKIDFGKNEAIYEELLWMENLKKIILNEWRIFLENRKIDLDIKINILNKVEELLLKRENVLESITKYLVQNTKNFNQENLIKILVRLQKLKCILEKSKEEMNHLELLEKIDLIQIENHVDLHEDLRRKRNREIEKEIDLLDNLKGLLDCEKVCQNKSEMINEVAKILWEINNIRKIQMETLLDMNEKIRDGMKIRRELKIIFDLQKNLESSYAKLDVVFKEIKMLKLKLWEKNNLF